MSDHSYICHDSLFLKKSVDLKPVSYEELIKHANEESVSYQELIDKTHSMIVGQGLDYSQVLKVWELRLTLLMFNNQLSVAKKEAINLNNALYLHENPNVTTTTPSNDGSAGRHLPPLQPIYPLPKNNESTIGHSLLVLILRLKSIPNMNLISELYKLTYQLKLKANVDESELKVNLINLTYDIVAVLIVTKNYLTLLNFLHGIQIELNSFRLANDSDHYSIYASNLSLIEIIVEALAHHSQDQETTQSLISKKYQHIYDDILESSKDSLLYSMQTVPANFNEELDLSETIELNSLTDLVDLVTNNKITARILCSTLGLWDLSNNYGFKLYQASAGLTYNDPDNITSEFKNIQREWCKYINKVYGLE